MLVTMDVGWTTFPAVPIMTSPVADVTGTDPAGNTLARTAFIGLILPAIVPIENDCDDENDVSRVQNNNNNNNNK